MVANKYFQQKYARRVDKNIADPNILTLTANKSSATLHPVKYL